MFDDNEYFEAEGMFEGGAHSLNSFSVSDEFLSDTIAFIAKRITHEFPGVDVVASMNENGRLEVMLMVPPQHTFDGNDFIMDLQERIYFEKSLFVPVRVLLKGDD